MHHICMLHNPKKLVLKGNNLAVDFKYASENSDLAFIPHPGGLFQAPENIDERIKPLRALGESFSMEVMNGLYQISVQTVHVMKHLLLFWINYYLRDI